MFTLTRSSLLHSPVTKALIGCPGALVSPKSKARAISFALRALPEQKKRDKPSPVRSKHLSKMRSPVKKQKQLAEKFNSPTDQLFSPVTKALIKASRKQKAKTLFTCKANQIHRHLAAVSTESRKVSSKKSKSKKVSFAFYVDNESHKSFPRTPKRKAKGNSVLDISSVKSKCRNSANMSKRKEERILQERSLNAASPIKKLQLV